MGKMVTDINNTYVQSLIAADGLDYWIAQCQELDSDCETPFDMALVQWGYYARNGNIGLNNTQVL